MTNHEHPAHSRGNGRAGGGADPLLRRGRWVFWIFGTIAAAYLVAEHRAHVVGALPFLVVLVCPLLHMLMHGRHGGHGGTTERKE